MSNNQKTAAEMFAAEKDAFYAAHPEITFTDPSRPQVEPLEKLEAMNLRESEAWLRAGEEPDGNLYSLEASPAVEMLQDDEGEWREYPVHGYSGEMVMPEIEPMTGTYEEVSEVAVRMNKRQMISGFVAFIFAPAVFARFKA